MHTGAETRSESSLLMFAEAAQEGTFTSLGIRVLQSCFALKLHVGSAPDQVRKPSTAEETQVNTGAKEAQRMCPRD